MTDIEAAEKTIAILTDKKDRAAARIQQIAEERKSVGFAVHADGDAKARKRLDQLNADDATMVGELQSLDAAITEATARLAAAKAAPAQEADGANARATREVLGAFREAGHELDDAMRDIGEIGALLQNLLSQLHNLGCQFPSHQQLNTLGAQALATSLMSTPWHKRYEHVPPNQRRTFGSLIDTWSKTIEASIAERLGEQQNERAA